MNEKQMITVALRYGNPIIFPNVEAAKKIIGENVRTWEFDYADFEKNDKKIYVLNGVPTLALTAEEKEAVQRNERVSKIKGRLIQIDRAIGSRCIRSAILQLANKEKIQGLDVNKLRESENEAERLRAELADLTAQKKE